MTEQPLIPTLLLDLLDDHTNPDHAHGRADAYDAIHNGTPLTVLETRLAWMTDPTISGTAYPAAYLTGYRAQIADWAAGAHAYRRAITHNDTYWEGRTPRLRGRALLDAKTVAEAEANHRKRLGITQAAWDGAHAT